MPADRVPELRFLLAALIWLLPGWALARALFRGRDPLARVSFAGAAAVAASTLLAFIAFLLQVPPGRLHLVLWGAAGAATVLLLLTARRSVGTSIADEGDPGPALLTRIAAYLSLGVLAAAGLRGGATMRFTGDGPDHVGTIREILASGSYFPTEAFHIGAGILGADPRKGLLHPVYAALCTLSGLDPVDLWMLLPIVTAPFLFACGYLFLRGLHVRPAWSVVGAWVLLLTWNRGIGGGLLSYSSFPNQVGEGMYWAAAGSLLIALTGGGRGRTLGGIGFARAGGVALLLFGAVAVHAMYLVFLALFGALVLAAVLVVRRAPRAEIGFLFLAAGLTAIPLVPYLLVRQTMYAPGNPIHTELQGMLLLGDGRFVADPLLIWGHVGLLGLVAYPLALMILARRWRAEVDVFLVFWGTIAVLILTFNPWLVPLLQGQLTYLVFRFSWFLPPAAAAMVVASALGAPRAAFSPRTRAVVIVLLLLACAPAVRSAIPPRWLTEPAARREALGSTLPWRTGIEAIAASLPARTVVLTDPVTGYVLPAFCGLKVTAVLDQHSSPNDSLAIRRIVEARNVLCPAVPPAEAAKIARDSGAAYVLVNGRFMEPTISLYMTMDSRALAERQDQLAGSPAWTEVAREDGFVVFRPLAVPAAAASTPDTTAAAKADSTVDSTSPGPALYSAVGLALLRAQVRPERAAVGESLEVDLAWTLADGPVAPAPRLASIRLDALDRPEHGILGGKLGRKILERVRGVRYRHRQDWIPGAGTGISALPPDLWRPGKVENDRIVVRVPAGLAPGRYAVLMGVGSFPNMPNHTLADYFTDRDLYSGVPVDTVTIAE
jgi:hypothetical protein